jgi:uroporphyrinogen-III synthase
MTMPQRRLVHHPILALITRPRREAAPLAAALAARGVEAVVEPLLDIHQFGGPPLDLGGVQALLCTSANGVRALAGRTAERNLPLLAVGDATAHRARNEGFSCVDSAAGAIDDLVRLVGRRLRPDAGRLLHVAGSAVAGDLSASLIPSGFSVDRTVLYEARPISRLSDTTAAALADGAIDIAMFYSPRTAAIFARLVDIADLADAMSCVTAISISAAADAALAALHFRERQVALRPDQPSLLAVLDRVLDEQRCPA